MSRTIKLYNPQGPHRVVVVSCEPSYKDPSQELIRVAQGKSAKQLDQGTAYGPYTEPELSARFDQIVTELRGQGYSEAMIATDIADLKDKNPKNIGVKTKICLELRDLLRIPMRSFRSHGMHPQKKLERPIRTLPGNITLTRSFI